MRWAAPPAPVELAPALDPEVEDSLVLLARVEVDRSLLRAAMEIFTIASVV